MAVYAHDDIMDAGLLDVKNNGSQMILCSGQPADYAAATTAASSGGAQLGAVTMAGTDFTIADGATSGRTVTVAAKEGVAIDGIADGNTATWDHVAVVDDTGTRLLLVTTVSSQTVTGGNQANVNSWSETIEDPVAA
mgnify:FL=1